jgi:hypothetical protein
MKILPAAVAALLCAGPAFAQEFIVTKPRQPAPIVTAPQPMPPKVEGIVKEVFTLKKPWQLVNPAAPKDYGDGRKNVSTSEKDPGKPKGFILFALDW